MKMIDAILDFWPVLLVLLNAIAAWSAWSLRQLAINEVRAVVAAATAELTVVDASLNAQVGKMEGRLVTLEESVRHLPTGDDVDKLTAAIASVDRSVAAQTATLAAVQEAGRATQNAVDRLYRYQLEKGA